jgi:hypothetical protein
MFGYKSLVLTALLVLLLSGCQPVSVEEAQAQLCTDLEEFRAAMDAVAALSPESSVDEAEAALSLVDDAWDDVLNSAYSLGDARYDDLDQAYEDLDDAIRDVEEGDSIQEAAASVQDEVANINAAYDEFYSVQCP